MKNHNDVSLYLILKVLNILILFASCLYFLYNGGNAYINSQTINLSLILSIINHCIIADAKKNKNSLLVIMAFVVISHYSFRILTLNITEFSLSFFRTNIGVNEINEAFSYTIISILILWIMLHYKRNNYVEDFSKRYISPKSTDNILRLLIISYILSIATSLGVPVIRNVVSMMSSFFFNMGYMILLSMCYFIYYKESITTRQKKIYAYSLIAYIVIYTLLGSRSTLYNLAIMLLFVLFTLDIFRIKKKFVYIGIILIPIAILSFSIATFLRFSEQAGLSFDTIGAVIEQQSKSSSDAENPVINMVCDRIGFFDYTTDVIYQERELKRFITPINYLKSIVDNLLTPGFNIWDMPRMSYIPSKIDKLGNTVSYSEIDLAEEYMSSEFTLFGEAHLLFGKYVSFLFYVFLAIIYRYFYLKYKNSDTMQNKWKLCIVLYSFYVILRSYGFDWYIIELVGLIINYHVFNYVIKKGVISYA